MLVLAAPTDSTSGVLLVPGLICFAITWSSDAAVAYRLLAESIVAQVSFDPIAWSCGSMVCPDPYAFMDRYPRGTSILLMYGVSGCSVPPMIESAVSGPLVTFGNQRFVRHPLC